MRINLHDLLRLAVLAICIAGIASGAAVPSASKPVQSLAPADAAFHDALMLEAGFGNYGAAAGAYRGFLEKFPASGHCARAQFRVGVCLKRLGRYGDAIRAFELALTRYPEKLEIVNRAKNEIVQVSKLVLTPGQRKQIDALAVEAGTADSTRKINIARQLTHMKVIAALPVLYAMLDDADVKVRLEALAGISALGAAPAIGRRAALPVLRKHANDPVSSKFRFEVKRVIENFELLTPAEMMSLLYGGDSGHSQKLAPAQAGGGKRRDLARRSLPGYKKSPLVDMLVRRLEEPGRGDEDAALTLNYLGFTGDRRKRPVCAEYMKAGKSELVRLSAAYAVALLGGKKEAVPFLRRGLESEDGVLRSLAANYLALLSIKDGCPVLIADLESRSLPLRRKAAQSLRSVSGESFGYDPEAAEENRRAAVKKWQNWWKKNSPR